MGKPTDSRINDDPNRRLYCHCDRANSYYDDNNKGGGVERCMKCGRKIQRPNNG